MLVRYKTFPSFFNEIDDLFTTTYPHFNRVRFVEQSRGVVVKDSGDAFSVFVELPGVAKEDVKVTLHDDVLTVAAERKQPELQEKDQWLRNEISYGKIERSVNLPYPVVADKVSATHENGILRITLPKAEEAKPKQISIR